MMYVRYKYLTRIYLLTVAVLHDIYTSVYGIVQLYQGVSVAAI